MLNLRLQLLRPGEVEAEPDARMLALEITADRSERLAQRRRGEHDELTLGNLLVHLTTLRMRNGRLVPLACHEQREHDQHQTADNARACSCHAPRFTRGKPCLSRSQMRKPGIVRKYSSQSG